MWVCVCAGGGDLLGLFGTCRWKWNWSARGCAAGCYVFFLSKKRKSWCACVVGSFYRVDLFRCVVIHRFIVRVDFFSFYLYIHIFLLLNVYML